MKRNGYVMLWIIMLAGLLSCGGTDLTAGGVGSGGSGTAIGPVTGYGSIIVGGVAYDDTGSTTVEPDASGSKQSTSSAPLGAQVSITLDSNGAAQTIELRPSLLGPVSQALDANGDLLEVLGQKVRLVQTTDSYNTATVVEGYDLTGSSSATQPQVGDLVVVHGVWLNEGSANAPQYVLQATRLEKRSVYTAANAYLLSGQVVSITTAQATVVRLNNSNGPSVNLGSATGELKNAAIGTQLNAWVAASEWDGARLTWRQLPLTALRAMPLIPNASSGQRLTLSGRVDAVDSGNRTVVIHGFSYTVPNGVALPGKGQEVQIELEGDAQSRWNSRQVQARTDSSEGDDPKDNLGESVSLRGTTVNPNWQQALPFALTLRGVTVQVDRFTQVNGCTNFTTGTSVQMLIKASRPKRGAGNQLSARTVSCALAQP